LSAHLGDTKAKVCYRVGQRGGHVAYCRLFGWQAICTSG